MQIAWTNIAQNSYTYRQNLFESLTEPNIMSLADRIVVCMQINSKSRAISFQWGVPQLLLKRLLLDEKFNQEYSLYESI